MRLKSVEHLGGIARAVSRYYDHITTHSLRYVQEVEEYTDPTARGLAECIGNMINHIMSSLEGSMGNIAVAVVT